MKGVLAAIGIVTLVVVIGAALLVVNLTTTTLSAQEAAEIACDHLDDPFDLLMTAAGPEGQATIEIRYSGDDHHNVLTIAGPDGAVMGKSESILKDGALYERWTTDAPDVYGEWEFMGSDFGPDPPLPCIDAGGFEYGAAGASDEAHYVSHTFLSEREGSVREEFWADSSGRPVRGRKTLFAPASDLGANAASDAPSNVTATIELTYSGYGEPNIITAPIATPTP